MTLFNWLSAELPGAHVLDLFAGTGVLGFEAMSRGADHATFVEIDPQAYDHLARVRTRLDATGAVIECADALPWLASQPVGRRWDVVFLDPPFDSALLANAIQAVADRLSPNGVVYAESDGAFDWETASAQSGLGVWRRSQAGAVRYGLLRSPTAPGLHQGR